MYLENKSGMNDGSDARIGWVSFSETGSTIYYRGLSLIKANGVSGNFLDPETGHEFWISGVKKRGSNVHWAGSASVEVDADALTEYRKTRDRGLRD